LEIKESNMNSKTLEGKVALEEESETIANHIRQFLGSAAVKAVSK